MKVPIAIAKKMITTYGGVYKRSTTVFEFYKRGMTIIKIPSSINIDYEHLEIIAIEQLEIGQWEFDYFLGENVRMITENVKKINPKL